MQIAKLFAALVALSAQPWDLQHAENEEQAQKEERRVERAEEAGNLSDPSQQELFQRLTKELFESGRHRPPPMALSDARARAASSLSRLDSRRGARQTPRAARNQLRGLTAQ